MSIVEYDSNILKEKHQNINQTDSKKYLKKDSSNYASKENNIKSKIHND
jgi:hypothetical protein